MIVTDNNALNSYLKTPPYFGSGREAPSVFEIAAPRRVPDTLQDRGTDRERESAEHRYATSPHPRQALLPKPRNPERERFVRADYQRLTQLHLPAQDGDELDPQLSRSTQLRAALARSGGIPEQLVLAGGHAFETPVQAHATYIAAKVHQNLASAAA